MTLEQELRQLADELTQSADDINALEWMEEEQKWTEKEITRLDDDWENSYAREHAKALGSEADEFFEFSEIRLYVDLRGRV